MKIRYRSIARDARNRAVQELADPSNARVRYAALELRTAMEALVYERVLIYEAELQDEALATWQPKQVFAYLLAIDPHADQSSSIAMARESSPGVPAEPLQHLGNDRVISTKEIKTYYDKIGSYLHAPTVQQMKNGSTTPDKMRKNCEAVLAIVDAVLASQVFAVDFKTVATISCQECGTTIVCRMPKAPEQGRAVDCVKCKASYRVDLAEHSSVVWKPMQRTLKCEGQGCSATCVVWEREIEVGTWWKCVACGGHNHFAVGIVYVPPETVAVDTAASKLPNGS